MTNTKSAETKQYIKNKLLLFTLTVLVIVISFRSLSSPIAPQPSPPQPWTVSWFTICIFVVITGIVYALSQSPLWWKNFSSYYKEYLSQNVIPLSLLSLILCLALALRALYLKNIPLGLYSDEALFGYDAYSIIQTGRDHYGDFLPIFFRGHGVYSNGLFYYCIALVFKILGPTIFALRLTGGLLSLIAIIFTYKIVRLYFTQGAAYIAALLLALSPWNIQFSRIAMDPVCLAPFFLIGFYLFSLGIRGSKRCLLFSALPIGLCFYCYAVAKLFVPLFFLASILLNIRSLWPLKWHVLVWGLLILLILAPFFRLHFTENKTLHQRFVTLSIFEEKNPSLHPTAQKELTDLGYPELGENYLGRTAYIFFRHYLAHFSLDFLLRKGDGNYRHHVGGRGQLLWFTFVFMIIGLVVIIQKWETPLFIFPLWLVFFPIPASLTWEGIPHAGRSIIAIPLFEILAGVGFSAVLQVMSVNGQKLLREKSLAILCAGLVSFSVMKGVSDYRNYLLRYFGEFPKISTYAHDYQVVAISEATQYLKDIDLFLMPGGFHPVSFLFLQKIDPAKWLEQKDNPFFLRYAYNPPPSLDLSGKRVAKIVKKGEYPEGELVTYIYHELTGEVLFEVRKLVPTQ